MRLGAIVDRMWVRGSRAALTVAEEAGRECEYRGRSLRSRMTAGVGSGKWRFEGGVWVDLGEGKGLGRTGTMRPRDQFRSARRLGDFYNIFRQGTGRNGTRSEPDICSPPTNERGSHDRTKRYSQCYMHSLLLRCPWLCCARALVARGRIPGVISPSHPFNIVRDERLQNPTYLRLRNTKVVWARRPGARGRRFA